METLIHLIAPLAMFIAGVTGFSSGSTSAVATANQQSVEFGLSEVSPRGVEGGFAMPASGCSDTTHGPIHDCALYPEINVNKAIIRLGESIVVSWDPRSNTNCVLTTNVTALPPATPNGNVVGSRDATPTGETTYSISCDGNRTDSATVKVLPRIQET